MSFRRILVEQFSGFDQMRRSKQELNISGGAEYFPGRERWRLMRFRLFCLDWHSLKAVTKKGFSGGFPEKFQSKMGDEIRFFLPAVSFDVA